MSEYEEFEKAMQTRGYMPWLFEHFPETGHYKDRMAAAMWHAWQAARSTPKQGEALCADECEGPTPGWPKTSRDWLAALVDIWDEQHTHAPEHRSYAPEALGETFAKARGHLAAMAQEFNCWGRRIQRNGVPVRADENQRLAALVAALKTHSGDTEGGEFGLARVKFDGYGKVESFFWATQDEIDAAIESALSAAPSVEPPQAAHQEPGWVSVKDRLPQPGTIVAVLVREWGEVPVTAYIGDDDQWVDSDVLSIPPPTHWLALPPAPKEPKP